MSNNSINKSLADFLFFQIAVEINILDAYSDILTKDEIKKIDSTKTVWAKTNDSILTPDNWSKKVDIFYKQRMETYNKSYADAEKINLELETLEKLTINKTEYKILKSRYKDYLLNKLQQPKQTDIINSDKNGFLLKENNFDNVEPQKVVKHFYKLVENGYITQSNFNLFIESLFYKNQKLNSKIEIIKPNSKSRVKKIFYTYYDSIQSEKYSNQEKYLKLLTDNFIGFNYKSLKTNFSK
ncbi:hypothetical protein OOZ35_06855 [Mesoflavibacter profundi]|uniref:Uncharacterized protein n=1 Tax=Mesoflavibacter profundi TaxID=2708110 RepID=A0ABT4RZF8_9FLAO|nr:hypothetical protein [Mesoflavibacter profundi]MDA0177207.1 hypothetical protein [Mesoflavibacter profundi]